MHVSITYTSHKQKHSIGTFANSIKELAKYTTVRPLSEEAGFSMKLSTPGVAGSSKPAYVDGEGLDALGTYSITGCTQIRLA